MQNMTIIQTITEDDFRQAYGTYYSTYLMTRFRPWFGAVMLAFGVHLIISQQQELLTAALLLVLFGCYLFMDKRIYVARRILYAKRAGSLPTEMQVELSSDGPMRVSAGGDSSELDLRRAHGYRVVDVGVLVYLRRTTFFILKRDAMEQAGGVDMIVSILDGHGLKSMR